MNIELTKTKLENIHADAICYGAKDTGEMGAGAANAILVHAGKEILKSLKDGLSRSSRQVGEVVVTDAFEMKHVKSIFHIISIIKNTNEGAYCPEPEKISNGVEKALRIAQMLNFKTIAFSALGTGEGRVTPQRCAELMISPMLLFSQHSHCKITLSLPTESDFMAFQSFIAKSYPC